MNGVWRMLSSLIQLLGAKLPVLLGGGIAGIVAVGLVWPLVHTFVAVEAFGVVARLFSAGAGALVAARYAK